MNTQKTFRLARAASSLTFPALAALLAAASTGTHAEVIITETFTPALNIPDLGFVTDTRRLGATLESITDVSVSLDIGVRGTGGFNGELVATLLHDSKTSVLLNQPGRNNDSLAGTFGYADSGGLNLTFADSATHDIHTYQDQVTPASGSPLTGTWQPDGRLGTGVDSTTSRDGMLNVFNGQTTSRDWSLVVEDTGFGGTLHRLNSWGLKVTGTPGANPVTLRDSSIVAIGGAGETFAGLVTVGGKTTFAGGPASLAGGLSLASTSELRVDTSVRVGGTISDDGTPRGLIKTGAGTLTIDGTATHTDSTTVREGTLVVDGSITASTTTVDTGGTLAGSGTLSRLELRGGILSPGHSPGIMTVASAVFGGGSSLRWEINDAHGTAGGPVGWDFLQINGNLEIEASSSNPFHIILQTLTVANANGLLYNFDPNQSHSWNLAKITGMLVGYSGEDFPADAFHIETDGFANAFDGSFTLAKEGEFLALQYTPVPEPAATVAVISSLLGVFAAFRRAQNRTGKS